MPRAGSIGRSAVAVLLLAGALAGCVAQRPSGDQLPSGPNVARQPGVEDPIEVGLRVHLADRPDETVPDATVVFFTTSSARPPEDGVGGVDGCGEGEDLEDWGPFEVLARTRTDRSGVAYGVVEPSRVTGVRDAPVHVAVGGVDGHLTTVVAEDDDAFRWACHVQAVYDDDANRSYLVPLLARRMAYRVEGSMGPGPATGAVPDGSPRWRPETPDPIGSRSFARDWAHRMTSITGELSWTNGPSAWSDLYLGVGGSREEPPKEQGTDGSQGPHSGRSRERIDAPLTGVQGAPLIGPATDEGVVGNERLPFVVAGNITFRGPDLDLGPT